MKKSVFKKSIMSLLTVVSIGGILTSCGGMKVDNTRLVIGMETNYQPFNWTSKNQTEFTLQIDGTNEFADGYDVQVARFLGETLNKPVVIKRMTWDSLIPSLNNQEINMVLAGMTDTSERRLAIDFTDPYLTSDLAFLIKTENLPKDENGNLLFGTKENPATYEELCDLFDGKGLVCQSTVVGDGYIEDYFTNNPYGKKIQHLNPDLTYPAAALQVSKGTAFAMPAELPVIEAMTNLDKANLSVLYVDYSFLSEEDKTGLSVSIGIKKGNTELKDELNGALAKLTKTQRNEMMGEAAKRSANN